MQSFVRCNTISRLSCNLTSNIYRPIRIAKMSSAIKAAQTTLSQNLGGPAQKIAPDGAKFSLGDVPSQKDKVAVITGGSEGIGYACAHTLLLRDIQKLFILSLSEHVIADSVEAIKEELGEDVSNRMRWIQCDLSDWKRVAEVAKQIKDETERIDILINNAARGVMTYQLTDYGVDRHMALNHVGHVILTSHLLPTLKVTANSSRGLVRISNQASNAHEQSPKDTKFASLGELNQDMGPMTQYGRSKLANILYSRYLTRHLQAEYPSILINATHPGVVETKMSSQDVLEPYPRAGYLMKEGLKPFKKDNFEGALSTM